MDLYAAAGKAGVNLLGGQLPNLAKVSGKLMGGEGFTKMMTKVFPDGVKNAFDGLSQSPGAEQLKRLLNPQPIHKISTKSGLDALERFDLDKNGQVSQDELKRGIENADKELKTLSGKEELTPAESKKIESLRQMRGFGKMMLNSYDGVAQLDSDKSGISVQDVKSLASLDKSAKSISLKDWESLLV